VPVFLLWPKDALSAPPPSRGRPTLVSVAALFVVAAAVLSGLAAFVDDSLRAFRFAGASVFTPGDREQMRIVEEATPRGAALLFTADRRANWPAMLWQRGLYPERTLVVLRGPLSAERVDAARSRYGPRFAVAIGDPPLDPGFRWRRDLGPAPSTSERIWFGELAR